MVRSGRSGTTDAKNEIRVVKKLLVIADKQTARRLGSSLCEMVYAGSVVRAYGFAEKGVSGLGSDV